MAQRHGAQVAGRGRKALARSVALSLRPVLSLTAAPPLFPPQMWIKKESLFEAVLPPEVFYIAQGVIRARGQRYKDNALIERLRGLFQQWGFLSGMIINKTGGMPSSCVCAHRFGSLILA